MSQNQYDVMMDAFGNNYHFFLRGFLGQWFKRKIIVDNITYNCNEQYMMAEKARLFGDQYMWDEIMRLGNPKDQKDAGRRIRNFDQKVWDENARPIVYTGNHAKFMQHQDFLDGLMETRGKLLVEANRVDSIWGIGMYDHDLGIEDRANWRGKNWLGQVHTKLREDIIKGVFEP